MSTPPLARQLAGVGTTYRTLIARITSALDAGASIGDIADACRISETLASYLAGQATADREQPEVAPGGNPELPPPVPPGDDAWPELNINGRPGGDDRAARPTYAHEAHCNTHHDPDGTPCPPALMIRPGVATTDGQVYTARTAGRITRRVSAWLDLATGEGVTTDGHRFRVAGSRPGYVLLALPEHCDRVYILGGPDAVLQPPAARVSRAEQVRAWFLDARLPEGWTVAGHYLADADAPVGRWTFGPTGRTVVMYRAAAWFGDVAEELTPSDACAAAAWIEMQLGRIRVPGQQGPAGAVWLATPATTGRDLMLRLLPAGAAYPVLSPDLRDLIKATSGQGRTEILGPVGDDDARTLPGLTYLDGRLMYAGLTWGMPDGQTTLWTGARVEQLSEAERTRTIQSRSRWHITYRVPDGWDHVGLLMTPTDDATAGGQWWYPAEPGATGTTWAGGSEVHLALQHGWDVTIHEGMSWGESKCLDTWTRTLVTMYERADGNAQGAPLTDVQQRACRAAARNMLLMGIGALAPRGHPVTRSTTDRALIPAGVEVRAVGDTYVWQQDTGLSDWSRRIARPEFAAAIWERARVRLLHGPTGATAPDGSRVYAGALHVPRRHVIAFRTDAIYLTHDPQWPSDDRPGRFRVKGQIRTPVKRPYTYPQLFALRDAAEEGGR